MANYLSRDNVEHILNLSPFEERTLSGDNPAARVRRAVYRLDGPIDAALLGQAWDMVVAAHGALRVVFRQTKGRTVRVTLKRFPAPLTVGGPPSPSHSIDPGTGPLVRAHLTPLADTRGQLSLDCHRAALDGHSLDLVVTDLLTTYDGLRRGLSADLDRPPHSAYLDWLNRQDWSEAERYWTEQLEACESPTALPLAPGSRAPAGPLTLSRTVPAGSEPAFGRLLEHTGAEALIAAAWAVLLSVYSGERRVLFGFDHHGRPEHLKEALGPLGDVLPLCLDVDGDEPLSDFIRRTGQRCADLVRCAPLSAAGARGVPAAGRLAFPNHVTVSAPLRAVGGELTARPLHADPGEGLTLTLFTDAPPVITMTGDAEGVEPEMADRMLGHMCRLLGLIASRPEITVRELDILEPSERHRLLVDFNARPQGGPLDRTAHEIIQDRVHAQPDATACISGDRVLTYEQVNTHANRIAHWLRSCGFGPDDLAAILAGRSPDMLAAILGVAKAGGAYVPLDPTDPDERLSYVLTCCRARVIITDAATAGRAAKLSRLMDVCPDVLCLDDDPGDGIEGPAAIADLPGIDPPVSCGPRDLANVFFTSGSTGQPKGAMVEQAGMLNHLWSKILLLGLDETSVVIQNASHCFDISVWQFLAPLMTGGRLVIADDETAADPDALLDLVRRERVTVLEVVPTMLELLLDADTGSAPLPDLRFLISTGEALPPKLCRRWLKRHPHALVVNAYGATECSDDTTHEVIADPPEEDAAYVPVGRPIPNFNIYVLDRWGRPAPIGFPGEIHFTGVGVGRGYLNDQERTALAFVPNPFADDGGPLMYRTGDLGRHLPDGRLVFLGRTDHQVKVRGHRIELGEVETAIVRCPGVSKAVAIVRPDSRGQNRILAYPVGDADPEEIREFLAARLPEYMVPEHIIPLDALPLNRNGKVDRKALPDPDRSRTHTAGELPQTATEIALAQIWEQVLEVSPIGLDDNFFALGGHSLKTIQVRVRIRRRFAVDTTLRTLFEHQTIRQLAPVIDELAATGESSTIARKKATGDHPMSHAQRRLWFIQRLDPNNASYNMTGQIELRGQFDTRAWEAAMRSLIARHASLRTTFPVTGSNPVQRVAEHVEPPLDLADLSQLDEQAGASELHRIATEMATAPFDLEAGPLIRSLLARLAPDRHVVLICIHHIIGDAWSWDVIGSELSQLYQAHARGLPDPLPPPAIQYPDYTRWHNAQLADGRLDESRRFWLDHLAGDLPSLELPTDRPRPPAQTYAGRTETAPVDPDVAARLMSLAARSGCTPFMILLAAAGTFLSRLTGSQQVVLGTPAAARPHIELEDQIGFYVNTLALRLDFAGMPSFVDVLSHVRELTLSAFSHQEYPFDLLVEQLNPVRDPARSPIFSVLFQVVAAPTPLQFGDLDARVLELEPIGSQFDMTIMFRETADGLDLALEYNTDLFDRETITRWMDHFMTLLAGIAVDPSRPAASFDLLTARERDQLVASFNPPPFDLPARAVHDWLSQWAATRPDAEAVVCGPRRLTYRQLNTLANRIAGYLQSQDIGPGGLAAIMAPRSPETVAAVFGILKAGAAYLPIDPGYPRERIEFMLADSGARLIAAPDLDLPLPTEAIRLDADLISQFSSDEPGIRVSPDDTAYVIYTSGSTGRPKGVSVTHANWAGALAAYEAAYELSTNVTAICQASSLSFDVFAGDLARAMASGGKLVICPPDVLLDPETLYGIMVEEGVDCADVVPAVLRGLLKYLSQTGQRLEFMRALAVGADIWHMGEHRQTAALCGSHTMFVNTYGITETTIDTTYFTHTSAQLSDGAVAPIGRPFANSRVYILDAGGQPVPIGVPGEIHIGGASVSAGYLNRPDLNVQRFVIDPFSPGAGGGAVMYRTGDLGRYLRDGNIEFLGRIDEQIKLHGHRIEPGEIEDALTAQPGVSGAAVIIREDRPGDKRLTAYIVPGGTSAADHDQLREALRQRLPEHMIPHTFVTLDALPTTPSGKIDRRALPAPARPHDKAAAVPRDRVELQVARLFERILNTGPIGPDDNFFSRGGHSLAAAALMAELRTVTGIDLPLSTLFRHPTVAGLSQQVQASAPRDDSRLVFLSETGDRTLFLVHPQGGGVFCYYHLANNLDSVAVCGIEAPGYDSGDAPEVTIEELADMYAADIRTVQPNGPWLIGGWSFGGTVAFEIARRLESVGDVGFAALFDTYPPAESPPGGTPGDPWQFFARELAVSPQDLSGLDEEGVMELLAQRGRDSGLLPPGAGTDTLRRYGRVLGSLMAADHRYRPSGPIKSDLFVFRVSDIPDGVRPVDPGAWKRLTRGRVHEVTVDGSHADMLSTANAGQLARAVEDALAAGDLPTAREVTGCLTNASG